MLKEGFTIGVKLELLSTHEPLTKRPTALR